MSNVRDRYTPEELKIWDAIPDWRKTMVANALLRIVEAELMKENSVLKERAEKADA